MTKLISEKKALGRLDELISEFKSEISDRYEHRAKNCVTCEVKGSCCLDAHFVNVHISRLEAVNINRSIEDLPDAARAAVKRRIERTIDHYDLSAEGDTYSQTYACPMFERGVGCLIHEIKPAACTMHACYEKKADLPPESLQAEQELRIDRLNERTYGISTPWLPLPLALKSAA